MNIRQPAHMLTLPRTLEAPSVDGTSRAATPLAQPAESAFGTTLAGALDALTQGQRNAEDAVGQVARGTGSLHRAALALEQADVSLKLAVKVRSRVVEAYQDIMRMPV